MITRKQNGYLIVEALISIFVLLMVTATAISLLVAANRAISYNANSLEASWITQEGVNGLRGLRDTNWIRFGYDKENCWNMVTDACPGTAITAGNFKIETSLSDPPLLTSASGVDFTDGLTTPDEPALLYYQADGTVSHNPAGEPSIFYRMIEVKSITGTPPNKIDAVVHVAWLQRHKVKTISLPVSLTNYMLEE